MQARGTICTKRDRCQRGCTDGGAGARAVIYKDIFTGDELTTDAFELTTVDDFFYEIDGKMISEGGEDIDIGANASAEGGGEEDGSDAVQVCNVVSAGRLQETNFGKKDYVATYKAYMKQIVKHLKQTNPDRVDAFKAVSDARWSEGSAFALLTAYNRVPRARRPP